MSRNALRIGTIRQIGIYLHWTFLLLITGLFTFYLLQGQDLGAALVGIGLILALFACIVLHELGHALTASRFGVATRDITLYPIGGVARLQRIPEEPLQEFWIAIAGPAVNLAIALFLLLVLTLTGASLSPDVLTRPDGSFVGVLLWLNLILVGFNLLPAFPMDGGRVLRSLLALRMGYVRATDIAASIGQAMAILFGVVGLISFNPILLFIALFVYIGAQQEARQASLRALTQGIPVREAMMTRFRTVSPDDTLDAVIQELLNGSDQDFPVVHAGQIVGVLTRKNLLKSLAERGKQALVKDVVAKECLVVEENWTLDEVFSRMQEMGCSMVPVVRKAQIVGVLTLENVGEYMMITSLLRNANSRSRAK